jgi:type II secretion system protein J
MHKFRGTPRGLTLIEIMGALAVSTLLLSGVWNLFQGGMQSYQRGMHEVRMTQRTRALLTLLTRDIQRAMAAHVPYGIHGTPELAAPAGAPRRADRLVLLTAPALPARHQDAQSSETLQRVRYVFTAAPTGNTFALQRAVALQGGKQTEHFMPVHEHVQTFHLRYFDGQTWSDAWQQAEVPRALEITMVVRSAGPQARTYQFATLVTAD